VAEANGAILVVDDEPRTRGFLEQTLRAHFAHVCCAGSAAEARSLVLRHRFDFLVTDVQLPGPTSGLALARELRDQGYLDIEVIFVTANAEFETAIGAFQGDTVDLLKKPFHIEQLLAIIKRAQERRRAERETYLLQRERDLRAITERMVGESEQIKEVWRIIRRIAAVPSTVLIKGETGTGKELVARALHDLSGRTGSYVPVNCGAISPDLIEGELFGHLKGAFTGAHQARQGLFSHADGGTLFLDEVGELPLGMQAKLLRVLEGRSYRPVGGNREIPVNTRVLAATNRDLAAEVLAGRFRKDLYYRINVIDVHLPALRERKSDIPLLASFFLKALSRELGLPAPVLDSWDVERMQRYGWPGNVRELRNVIERSLLLGKPPSHYLAPCDPCPELDEDAPENPLSLENVEKSHIMAALRAASGNKTVAARTLGVSRKTVERKLKEWGKPCSSAQSAN
ncbi:MAG: sigma-54 dependent transcriptional regulator, partial [Rhodocyclaceae bacterium]